MRGPSRTTSVLCFSAQGHDTHHTCPRCHNSPPLTEDEYPDTASTGTLAISVHRPQPMVCHRCRALARRTGPCSTTRLPLPAIRIVGQATPCGCACPCRELCTKRADLPGASTAARFQTCLRDVCIRCQADSAFDILPTHRWQLADPAQQGQQRCRHQCDWCHARTGPCQPCHTEPLRGSRGQGHLANPCAYANGHTDHMHTCCECFRWCCECF